MPLNVTLLHVDAGHHELTVDLEAQLHYRDFPHFLDVFKLVAHSLHHYVDFREVVVAYAEEAAALLQRAIQPGGAGVLAGAASVASPAVSAAAGRAYPRRVNCVRNRSRAADNRESTVPRYPATGLAQATRLMVPRCREVWI